MIQPDEEILKAIINLEGNPNWDFIKFWFQQGIDETLGAKEEYWKGKQDQLLEVLKEIKAARKTLKLIEGRKPKR